MPARTVIIGVNASNDVRTVLSRRRVSIQAAGSHVLVACRVLWRNRSRSGLSSDTPRGLVFNMSPPRNSLGESTAVRSCSAASDVLPVALHLGRRGHDQPPATRPGRNRRPPRPSHLDAAVRGALSSNDIRSRRASVSPHRRHPGRPTPRLLLPGYARSRVEGSRYPVRARVTVQSLCHIADAGHPLEVSSRQSIWQLSAKVRPP